MSTTIFSIYSSSLLNCQFSQSQHKKITWHLKTEGRLHIFVPSDECCANWKKSCQWNT